MPKNKGRNAFFFFMIDWRKRAEARGRTFPNGLKDVQADPDCNEEWRSLSKQEKGPFEAMAKQDKVTAQLRDQDKKTSLGESISVLEQREKEERQAEKDMHESIKFSVDTAINLNILPKSKFCFMHVNHFFAMIVNNKLEYFPAEYALGIFSLEGGIEEVHHTIVSAEIPLGYKREALETSQNSHHIPIEYQGGETDFADMCTKFIDFLEPRKVMNKYPPLYTRTNCLQIVKSVIGKLCDAAQEDKAQFQVYELEALYMHLANEVYKKRTDRKIGDIPALTKYLFTRYTYIFEKGFECSFHKFEDGGSEYCSKSILRHWAWTMCEEFCEPLGVKMHPGIHYPVDRSEISDLANSLRHLKVDNASRQSVPEFSVLSMTGVSEHHRLKKSSMTYEDEIRRRMESKPIEVIDYSKLNKSFEESVETPVEQPVEQLVANPVDKPVDKLVDKPVDQKINVWMKNVPNYLNEKPLRAPNIQNSYVIAASNMEDYILDEESFPPIGGRGVSNKSTRVVKKLPLGRGQGHA